MLIALALVAAGAATGLGIAWNVWYAESHTPTAAPGAVEQGRQNLHAQLEQSEQREAEIEKLYWNQPEKLEQIIEAHQQRYNKLTGNPTAGEIQQHDQQAVARLQQRIQQIWAERKAAAEAEAARAAALEEQEEEQGQQGQTGQTAQ